MGGEGLETPAIEKVREQGRRPPGEEVEQDMEMRVGGEVEQLGAFRCGGLTDWLLAFSRTVNRVRGPARMRRRGE